MLCVGRKRCSKLQNLPRHRQGQFSPVKRTLQHAPGPWSRLRVLPQTPRQAFEGDCRSQLSTGPRGASAGSGHSGSPAFGAPAQQVRALPGGSQGCPLILLEHRAGRLEHTGAHLSWFWRKSLFSRHSYTQPGAKRAAEKPCFRISSSDWGDRSQSPGPEGPDTPLGTGHRDTSLGPQPSLQAARGLWGFLCGPTGWPGERKAQRAPGRPPPPSPHTVAP